MSKRPTREQSISPKRPSRGQADLLLLREMTERSIRRTAPPELADLREDFWADGQLVTPTLNKSTSLPSGDK